MRSFFSDKRWQLAAAIGLPALYEALRAVVALAGAGDLVIHDATTTGLVVAAATLVVREIASHREGLGIRQELGLPPPATEDSDALRAALRALLDRHEADAALLAAFARAGAVAPAGGPDAQGAKILEAGAPPADPPPPPDR